MAIGAADLDRRGDLAIDVAVAVAVLGEMAVDAVHAGIDMDRRHVDRLLELLGVLRRDHVVGGVEQVALAVALVDGAEIPAMAVVIGELRVLQVGIEGADLAQEGRIRPIAAD